MKTIDLLLSRSGTALSRTIAAITGDEYTHVSVGIDPGHRNFYSFGRIRPHFALPAGFVRETLDEGYFGTHRRTPCLLYALDVEDAAHAFVSARLSEMEWTPERYAYNLLGLLLCRFDLACERDRHFFCSQFAAELLARSGAMKLPKPASLMRPMDFLELPGLRLLYAGEVGDVARACLPKGEPA